MSGGDSRNQEEAHRVAFTKGFTRDKSCRLLRNLQYLSGRREDFPTPTIGNASGRTWPENFAAAAWAIVPGCSEAGAVETGDSGRRQPDQRLAQQ